MSQHTLPFEEPSLFEQVYHLDTLHQAFKAVRKNRGAAGPDGVTTNDFQKHLNEELAQLSNELKHWRYQPSPVRAVELPKPDGGIRTLGIPCVRDRVVQMALKLLLEPPLEPTFSKHSYGFRPNRNAHQAVEQAQALVASGQRYVVDLDLSQFFDRIHHDRLIARLKPHIQDKRILRLIGMTLRSGILRAGMVSATGQGAPQGSPLSPLLSNLVLDELDKELERRGLAFVRYADDCNVFVGSQKAADRVLQSLTRFIETKLKLIVNRDKSKARPAEQGKFLGMTIVNGTVAISKQAIRHAISKVKALIPRGTSEKLETTVAKVNRWYTGWANYYSMTQYPAQLKKIEARTRRRFRARMVARYTRRKHLYRKLMKSGVKSKTAYQAVYSHRKRWALSHTGAVERAFPNQWFKNTLGLKVRSEDHLAHWFEVRRWVNLT